MQKSLQFFSPVSEIQHCNLNAEWHPPFSLVLKAAWCLYWWKIPYLPETSILLIVSAGWEKCLTQYLKTKIFHVVNATVQKWLVCFPHSDNSCRALTDDCLLGRGIHHISSLLSSWRQLELVWGLHWHDSWWTFLVPITWEHEDHQQDLMSQSLGGVFCWQFVGVELNSAPCYTPVSHSWLT